MAIVSSIIVSSLTNYFCYNFSKCGKLFLQQIKIHRRKRKIMKKKLLIIPLLLTSCNDPMFFEGKKATHEEMQSVIDKIDNNGAFIKPSWYEYNAEII